MAILNHWLNGESRGPGKRLDATGDTMGRASLSGHTIRALVGALELGLFTPAELQKVYEFDAADMVDLSSLRTLYAAAADKEVFLDAIEILSALNESDDSHELGIRDVVLDKLITLG